MAEVEPWSSGVGSDRSANCATNFGRGSGQMVSALAFNSDNPSSNPA